MYEEECCKNKDLLKVIRNLKLDIENLKYELKYQKDCFENKIKISVEKATFPLIKENTILNDKLKCAYNEINRLKIQISNNDDTFDKDYKIDKLTNQVNKNSTNSGIPTSKEIGKKKTGANTYNHRTTSSNKTGGQIGHKGETLTKEKLKNKIKETNIKVKQIIHYIKGTPKQEDVIKYKIGMNVNVYVEEHIFKHTKKSKEILPKEYYSDVTYNNDLKALMVIIILWDTVKYKKYSMI